MNQELLAFFNRYYAPGRICLVGADDAVGIIVRTGQITLTVDKNPSKWSHAFLMGLRRDDGRSDGSIYIFESDLRVNTKNWQVHNGVMESRLVKWCGNNIEHACVLALSNSINKSNAIIRTALEYAYDEHRLHYPISEMFGTLRAILTKSADKMNIYNQAYAVQCATFIRMCYQNINEDFITNGIHSDNISPEVIYQSTVFGVREQWNRKV
jgi:hypothetical protein